MKFLKPIGKIGVGVFIILICFSCSNKTQNTKDLTIKTFFDEQNQISNPNELLKSKLLKPLKLSRNTFYYGFKTSNLWFEINLNDVKDYKYIQLNNALLDNIVIYKIRNQTILDSIITGDTKPFRQREFNLGTFLFSIDTTYQTYLFKVNTKGMLSVPLVFFKNEDIIDNKHIPNILYFGVLILAIVFILLLLIRFRENIYLYYFASILSISVTISVDWGFLFQFLWPNIPAINDYMGILYSFLVFLALFADKFLELKKHYPFLHKIYKIIYIAFGITALINILGNYNLSILILLYISLIIPFLNLFAGIITLRKKMQMSVFYFIFAFLSYCFFSTYYILSYMGLVKVSMLSNNAIPIANSFEIIFLFLAVIERFFYSENNRKKSDKLLLEALQKNKEILEHQNTMLETKVMERTNEILQLNEELISTNEELLNNNEKLHQANTTLEEQKDILEKTLYDLKQTQDKLIQSEKMAALGTLVAGVAHEINNPLNFIYGGVNLLKDIEVEETKTQDKFKLSLQMIKEGVSRASNIVKSLTTYSHKGNSKLQPYNIEQIIDDCLLFLKTKFPNELNIEKHYSLFSEIPVFPEKLHQVFLNILDNALFVFSHSPLDSIPLLKIETKLIADNAVSITLFNSGPAIPENVLNHIFDPFYTTKEPGEGTGLGLSISYNIIQEHKGNITVVNKENGVEFAIILPIQKL